MTDPVKRGALIGIGIIVAMALIALGGLLLRHIMESPGTDYIATQLAADASFSAAYGTGCAITPGIPSTGEMTRDIGGGPVTGTTTLTMTTAKGNVRVIVEWEKDARGTFRIINWRPV